MTTSPDVSRQGFGSVLADDPTGHWPTVEGVMDYDQESAPLRGELLAHCYRMLGSWDEADDAVQETYLRGWRGWEAFEHRASVRTWLHGIATNVCLNAVRDRARRALPSGLGGPSGDDDEPRAELPPETWIQPFASDREDLRLAFVAALQTLSARQRAVLLLRETLGFSASEVAGQLDISVAAVKSALQRARARLADAPPRAADVVEPHSPRARRLLDAYVTAFERGEIEGLLAVLRADATLELVPYPDWFAGKGSCERVLRSAVVGAWRMERIVANGQPGVVAYRDGEPLGVAVLDVRVDGIAGITVFAQTRLVGRFA